MTIFWWTKRGPSEQTQDEKGQREAAEQARLDANLSLEAARNISPEINALTSSLRSIRDRDHFGEAIEAALMRRHRGRAPS